jgi:hypothetical protein
MINYDKERGVAVHNDRSSSVLVVAEAQKSDSGNYSCVPSNARPASINVHVLNGKLINPLKPNGKYMYQLLLQSVTLHFIFMGFV